MYLTISYSYNSDVEKVQRLLNKARKTSLYNNAWGELAVDGIFGQQTRVAVMEFQHQTRLQVDGIVGDQTMKALNSVASNAMAESPKLYFTAGSAQTYITTAPPDAFLRNSPQDQNIGKVTYEVMEYLAKNIINPLADTLKTASDAARDEIARFKKGAKLTSSDIRRIANSMFNKPNVNVMRQTIVNEVYVNLQELARGNTNIANYKNNSQTAKRMADIGSAKRQLKKGLSPQTLNSIEKTLGNRVMDRCIAELESVNFERMISEKVGKANKLPKGCGILTALSLLPLALHLVELGYNLIKGLPTDAVIKKIVADVISLVVGIIIGAIIALVVAAIGLTGGTAVLVIVVVGLVIGLILSFFCPDWEAKAAEKLVNWLNGVIHSPVFLDSVRKSFV